MLWWLGFAAAIALLARLARTLQDYLLRLVVQKFGVQLFNDGLRQTLRLSFQEIESRSQRRDGGAAAEGAHRHRAVHQRAINVFFSSIVGVGFLIFYAVTTNWR